MHIGLRGALVQAIMMAYVRGASYTARLASQTLKEMVENKDDPQKVLTTPPMVDRELLHLSARAFAEDMADRLWRGVTDAGGGASVSEKTA